MIDLPRMRRERRERLLETMSTQGVDALVLLGQSNVSYATGAGVPAADSGRAGAQRTIAIVTADGEAPHVFTWFPQLAPPDVEVHGGLAVELDARGLCAALPPGRIAFDELTVPVWSALRGRELVDAASVLSAAKVVKTADELACIRRAQEINEAAIADLFDLVSPGVPSTALTGRFLRRVLDLGATANTVDPIWQVMPPRLADGPSSVTGDLVFPTVTTRRSLESGDVVWVDTGLDYEGYASDFGTTWYVGGAPTAQQRKQFDRWRAVVDRALAAITPGATAGDLVRAAEAGEPRRPWLPHLYLAHGLGTGNAELPFVGTDLGSEFDDGFVLAPGMVLVFEPIIWEDGAGGYRAEEIVAVTERGYELLSAPVEWAA